MEYVPALEILVKQTYTPSTQEPRWRVTCYEGLE